MTLQEAIVELESQIGFMRDSVLEGGTIWELDHLCLALARAAACERCGGTGMQPARDSMAEGRMPIRTCLKCRVDRDTIQKAREA